MGTQVTFRQCRPTDWRTPRPGLVPDFYGDICCNPHTEGRESCLYKEPPRREDRLPIKFGSGVPGVNSAVTDLAGIPKARGKVQKASTMEGSVTLPTNFQESAYIPSIAALEILTHTSDTRRLAPPARYYR